MTRTEAAPYRYNATGDLVSMTDWLGTTTFELDLLHQLTATTDHAGKRVEYTYDGMGCILKVEDTHPSEKPTKTQKEVEKYFSNDGKL